MIHSQSCIKIFRRLRELVRLWPRLIGLLCVAVVCLDAPAARAAITVETGVDVLSEPRSEIEALHRLSAFGGGPRLRYGQSIYSAAAGDAGGAFFWGYEVGSSLPLTSHIAVKATAFVGGGGGAAQVNGDGLMLRGSLGLSCRATDRLSFDAGIAWIGIDGAAVEDPALSLGLAVQNAPGSARAGRVGPHVSSVAAGMSVASLGDSFARSGLRQSSIALVGTQVRLPVGKRLDAVVTAEGAASGGEGYMQVMAGVRNSYPLGFAEVFGQVAVGFGGGGDVDSGGGGLVLAGVGPKSLWVRTILSKR